jgi:hypothetical protein
MAYKMPIPLEPELPPEPADPKQCSICGGQCVRGDFSSVANFGVTREPHFVTSYGWMQVKFDRATPIDVFMCLQCGKIEFYGRNPMAVLDPMERQRMLRDKYPELDKKMSREERRRKELEKKGLPFDGDEHTGI